MRQIYGESIVLLGGGRALLLQLAHPLVAKGVAEHSSFQGVRLQRLLNTLRLTLGIVFQDADSARAAAIRVNRSHRTVVGEGYAASDPELSAWVLATLIDTTVVSHERFLRPLTPEEKATYYQEMRYIGTLLGVPLSSLPETFDGFEDYFECTLNSLAPSADSRRLAREVFNPWPPQWLPLLVMKWLSCGLLPAAARSGLDMRWGSRDEKAFRLAAGLLRSAYRLIPRQLRRPPSFLTTPPG